MASQLGWNSLRVGGPNLPEDFNLEGTQPVIYAEPLAALGFARQLGAVLLAAGSGWLATLNRSSLKREVRSLTLGDVRRRKEAAFVKAAVSKSFPAGVYHGNRLPKEAAPLPDNVAVYVAEPVIWDAEFRAFILEGKVLNMSAYRYHNYALTAHERPLPVPAGLEAEALDFCQAVVRSVDCPPAFVLDVGMIHSRGWAVIEANESWASGIYTCDPVKVLKVLQRACVASGQLTSTDQRWDFRPQFLNACPHLRESV